MAGFISKCCFYPKDGAVSLRQPCPQQCRRFRSTPGTRRGQLGPALNWHKPHPFVTEHSPIHPQPHPDSPQDPPLFPQAPPLPSLSPPPPGNKPRLSVLQAPPPARPKTCPNPLSSALFRLSPDPIPSALPLPFSHTPSTPARCRSRSRPSSREISSRK